MLEKVVAEPDPYNLRLTRQDTFCLSGVRIPPGLVGYCHETPISSELFERQAPELATIQHLLHQLRRRTGMLATFEVVEKYRRWADQWLPPASFAEEPEAAPSSEENREL